MRLNHIDVAECCTATFCFGRLEAEGLVCGRGIYLGQDSRGALLPGDEGKDFLGEVQFPITQCQRPDASEPRSPQWAVEGSYVAG